MTVLLDERLPRTLDALVKAWARPETRGTRLEGWLFEDREARHRAEAQLARAGVLTRLRSAYKPLVHAFLEDIPTKGLKSVRVTYPVHPEADPRRFLLESYPLAALLGNIDLAFEPGAADLTYVVRTETLDGRTAEHNVFAPNRLHPNHLGGTDLSPTGWLKATHRPSGQPDLDERLGTDAEALFGRVMEAVAGHSWPEQEPYCETLSIEVATPGIERALPYGDEVMSTREALHEDLYFSLLEWFKQRSGRPPEDRGVKPGRIVPDVRAGEGDPHVRVVLHRLGEGAEPARPDRDIETADGALSLRQIERELASLAGDRIEGRSREGRPIRGLYRWGSRPAILVTAGQHANETSGPVGALRAAARLLDDPEAHVAVVPLENPDGYALHARLCEANPRHMHHAARYTALGNDLEYGSPEYEIDARCQGIALSDAKLHINLHGYPAHEWTRPFTGYLPRGFELWTIPKGFFLIMRHHAEWASPARALVEGVAERLAEVPGLLAFNARQLEVYALHSGSAPYEMLHGIPCLVAEDARSPVPMTLITEFPDETIYGEAFRFAHEVQMWAVLAAEEAHAGVMAGA
ncbi:MAG TPA: M14 family zinc carboxypeptidase [Microvirga sp.]|jgi:hypothetical protein|nr:M14 family zinc carboxypeptidase [Microvirga sp.]